MRGIDEDDVVAMPGPLQVVVPVVQYEPHIRFLEPVQDVVVGVREMGPRRVDHLGNHLYDIHPVRAVEGGAPRAMPPPNPITRMSRGSGCIRAGRCPINRKN